MVVFPVFLTRIPRCASGFFFFRFPSKVLSAVSEAGQFEVAIRLVQQMRAAGNTPSKVEFGLVSCFLFLPSLLPHRIKAYAGRALSVVRSFGL